MPLAFGEIRNLVRCGVCEGFSDKPKILRCQHSFCLGCLDKNCSEKKRGRNSFCPKCGIAFEIPYGGCINLPTNSFAQLVDVIFSKYELTVESRMNPSSEYGDSAQDYFDGCDTLCRSDKQPLDRKSLVSTICTSRRISFRNLMIEPIYLAKEKDDFKAKFVQLNPDVEEIQRNCKKRFEVAKDKICEKSLNNVSQNKFIGALCAVLLLVIRSYNQLRDEVGKYSNDFHTMMFIKAYEVLKFLLFQTATGGMNIFTAVSQLTQQQQWNEKGIPMNCCGGGDKPCNYKSLPNATAKGSLSSSSSNSFSYSVGATTVGGGSGDDGDDDRRGNRNPGRADHDRCCSRKIKRKKKKDTKKDEEEEDSGEIDISSQDATNDGSCEGVNPVADINVNNDTDTLVGVSGSAAGTMPEGSDNAADGCLGDTDLCCNDTAVDQRSSLSNYDEGVNIVTADDDDDDDANSERAEAISRYCGRDMKTNIERLEERKSSMKVSCNGSGAVLNKPATVTLHPHPTAETGGTEYTASGWDLNQLSLDTGDLNLWNDCPDHLNLNPDGRSLKLMPERSYYEQESSSKSEIFNGSASRRTSENLTASLDRFRCSLGSESNESSDTWLKHFDKLSFSQLETVDVAAPFPDSQMRFSHTWEFGDSGFTMEKNTSAFEFNSKMDDVESSGLADCSFEKYLKASADFDLQKQTLMTNRRNDAGKKLTDDLEYKDRSGSETEGMQILEFNGRSLRERTERTSPEEKIKQFQSQAKDGRCSTNSLVRESQKNRTYDGRSNTKGARQKNSLHETRHNPEMTRLQNYAHHSRRRQTERGGQERCESDRRIDTGVRELKCGGHNNGGHVERMEQECHEHDRIRTANRTAWESLGINGILNNNESVGNHLAGMNRLIGGNIVAQGVGHVDRKTYGNNNLRLKRTREIDGNSDPADPPGNSGIRVVAVSDMVSSDDPIADVNTLEVDELLEPVQVSGAPHLMLETYTTHAMVLQDASFQRIISNAINPSLDAIESMRVNCDEVNLEPMEINVLRCCYSDSENEGS